MFYHFPPLTDLFAAITRLLWLGFGLLTLGIAAGFFTGQPLPYGKVAWSLGVWIFYAAILLARHLGTTAPRRIAAALRDRLQRRAHPALGDHLPLPDPFDVMHLFCVGLSHHTANVETRERFIGHAEIDRVLREGVGCAEALLLTTCNRVEVYAAAEHPIPTEQIAHCLLS